MDVAQIFKSFSFLIAIIAFMYLCVYFYRRNVKIHSTSRRIEIIERCALDPKTTIHLVRIDGAEMVIVSHAHSVSVQPLSSSSRSGGADARINPATTPSFVFPDAEEIAKQSTNVSGIPRST